jgi:hypothetical protein
MGRERETSWSIEVLAGVGLRDSGFILVLDSWMEVGIPPSPHEMRKCGKQRAYCAKERSLCARGAHGGDKRKSWKR